MSSEPARHPGDPGVMALETLDGFGAVLRFRRFGDPARLVHAFTTAIDPQGDLKADAAGGLNRRRLLAERLGADAVAWARQVHGRRVVSAEQTGGGRLEADAVITDRPGQAVLCLSADCPIVLLADLDAGAVAAVHCGWRGIAADVIAAAVERMRADYGCDPSTLLAAITPAAGPCCYEVGGEVIEAVEKAVGPLPPNARATGANDKFMFDPVAALTRRLTQLGLSEHTIDVAGLCSICDDRLHSFRRDGELAGRAGAIIALKG